ncbi:lipopolysaccharide 1,2-N-acetylglucosaminetransferase, partial [Salmonella enterica]|nr:lipopolysaccharide 1,2-N-acetylglucosaminetransferase [Salmonella enterica]
YLPDADIAIVPNGIDLEAYQKNAVPLQKSDLGITPEKKRFSLQAVYHRIRE